MKELNGITLDEVMGVATSLPHFFRKKLSLKHIYSDNNQLYLSELSLFLSTFLSFSNPSLRPNNFFPNTNHKYFHFWPPNPTSENTSPTTLQPGVTGPLWLNTNAWQSKVNVHQSAHVWSKPRTWKNRVEQHLLGKKMVNTPEQIEGIW